MPPAEGVGWPPGDGSGERDEAQAQAQALVERLEGALHRQDLDLDEEQGLLESLLRASAACACPDSARPEEALPALLPLDAHGWSRLVSYAFERRYGWSESADVNNDRAMDSLDNRAKKKINDALEQVDPQPRPAAVCARGRGAARAAVSEERAHSGPCLRDLCALVRWAASGLPEGAPAAAPNFPGLCVRGTSHRQGPPRLRGPVPAQCPSPRTVCAARRRWWQERSWDATDADTMVAGSCVAEACGAAAVLFVHAGLGQAAGDRR